MLEGTPGDSSLGIERLEPAHGKLYTQPKFENLGTYMARPRMPTALLELRGGFKNRPSRRRARQYEPIVTTELPEPRPSLPKPVRLAWLEMQSRGFWLTSADRFLVEIAATLMARYRFGEIKSGDVSQLIGLLGKIGFGPKERSALNLPTKGGE
jgi:hypothetical protein